MAVPAHDGKRHIMLKWSGAKRAFFAQSSALVTYLLTLTPDTYRYYNIAKNKKNVIPKQGANNLLLTILLFLFIANKGDVIMIIKGGPLAGSG